MLRKSISLVGNPLGRLFQVSGGTAGVQQFLYDGDALVAEYGASGALLRHHVHGANAGADDPLFWYENVSAGRRPLFADHQGSIVVAADWLGNPFAINAYDAWGIPNSANQGRFGYTGQTWIPELGLWYYKARFYSPRLGRFLQTDPVGYDDQVNLYAYVGNDPVNMSDPTGTCRASRVDVAEGSICAGSATIAPENQLRPNRSADLLSIGSSAPALAMTLAAATDIPSPPQDLPGGPYQPKPDTPGNRAGSFQGPAQPTGARSQAQWVPPAGRGGTPGSRGYWKVQLPGQAWQRFDQRGRPMTAQQAHPNPRFNPFSLVGRAVGFFACLLLCESPAHAPVYGPREPSPSR